MRSKTKPLGIVLILGIGATGAAVGYWMAPIVSSRLGVSKLVAAWIIGGVFLLMFIPTWNWAVRRLAVWLASRYSTR